MPDLGPDHLDELKLDEILSVNPNMKPLEPKRNRAGPMFCGRRAIAAFASFCAAISFGCSSVTSLTVQSNPTKASVYVKPVGGGEAKLLGETPLSLDNKTLPPEMKSGPTYIEVRKDGFKSSEVLVTDIMGLIVTINRELEAVKADSEKKEGENKKVEFENQQKQLEILQESLKVNGAIDRLFEAQRLARVGRTEEALQTLKVLKEKFPSISAIYELEGGIYFLAKKLPEALDDYRLAIRYNSANAESSRMVAILENLLGLQRKPANSESLLPTKAIVTSPGAAAPAEPVSLSPEISEGKPSEGTNKEIDQKKN